MNVNFIRTISLSAIIFLIGFQNAVADQSINLNLSPSQVNANEISTFSVELTSSRNLSNIVIHFYVDAEKKGAKYVVKLEKNRKYFTNFDYFFNKNSYLGEHYIELKIDYVTEYGERNSESFYAKIDVYGNKKLSSYIFIIFFLHIAILIGGLFYSRKLTNSKVKFDQESRKTLFSFLVTVLPISISIFALYLSEKPELKLGMFSILLSFTISFFLAFYLFIQAEKKGEVEANNITLFSLIFLFIGLIEMVILVAAF